MESGGVGGDKPIVVPELSPPGGPIFWNWFAAKVADEVVKHKDTRLVEDVRILFSGWNGTDDELRRQRKITVCCICEMPISNKEYCSNCGDSYCQRDYYCRDSCGVFQEGCDVCAYCHDVCVVCGKRGIISNMVVDCDCGAKNMYACKGMFDVYDGNETYCVRNDKSSFNTHHYCEEHKDMADNCILKEKNKRIKKDE